MKGWEDPRSPSSQAPGSRSFRWFLILYILVAFAHLVWRLDVRNLWWDESLSLQRAESSLPALVLGRFVFDDGATLTPSHDQHPFVYFLLLGTLTRLAGQSDFALRFVSVAAATLLVPMSWAFARLLVRRGALPPTTPLWAALLAAINPFYLWYGREARMYTLVPLLALLSTYLLLRWMEHSQRSQARRYLVLYATVLALLLLTHYLSLLILPVHAGLIFAHLYAQNRRRAIMIALGLLGAGLVLGLVTVKWILQAPGSGANFSRVAFPILLQDLLNAFSLGLSVNVDRVRWLDFIFAAVALVGALWGIRRTRGRAKEAWLLPGLLIVPVILLQIIQQVQPAYMNARHMSLISGAFVLLVAGGLAAIWQYRRWIGLVLAALLVGGIGYSTFNYFTSPEYAKDQFAEVGEELAREIQPGDGLVLVPVEMVRLYRHYLPVEILEAATVARAGDAAETQRGWQALPQLNAPFETTEERLRDMLGRYDRIWLVASGMVPLSPFQEQTRGWLSSNAFLAREVSYESNTLLWLKLYLPKAPVLDALPDGVQHPIAAVFGDKIRVAGVDIGQPLTAESVTPVTLYWQPLQKMDRRYKYILRLVSEIDAGSLETLAVTEREPYHGTLPTTFWGPGQTIVEHSGLPLPPRSREGAASSRLGVALQMYDAETLEKLPVSDPGPGALAADGETLLLPYAP